MYQMLIADDERIIRQGLKNVVDWEKLGFEVADTFSDGQEIIEYLEYMIPDVILTDIKMEHVSGLEIAKQVFEKKLPCVVVLVSGYQEFDLAVQGLRYGAENYLLKPVDVDELLTTFEKIKRRLDEKSTEREQARAEKERMEEALPMLEERFFTDLVLGVADGEDYIKSRMAVLYPDLDAVHRICMLADITIRQYGRFMEEIWEYSYDQLEVNLTNFLRIYRKNFTYHIVFKTEDTVELLGICVEGQESGTDLERFCGDALGRLVSELEHNFRFQADYCVKQIYKSVYGIGKKDGVLKNRNTEEIVDAQHLREQKKLVMSNLSMGNIVTAQKLFHNVLQELKYLPASSRNNQIIEILLTMNTVIKEVNGKLAESLQTYFNYAGILSTASLEEIREDCDRIFDRIRLAEEKKEYFDAGSLIAKAKSYIQENISRDISQEETAGQLFICASYLSRLFKKQTGENFTQYVTRVKMERAIELLKDPKYKTYQVSEALGYKTPRYFSRLFRAQTGMNPSEYRGKVLHIGESYEEI